MRIPQASFIPLLVAILLGCQYSIEHTPKGLPSVSADVPQLTVKGPVRVVNGQRSSEQAVVETRRRKVAVNYSQYTASAVDLLRETLVAKGISVADTSDKSMTISIINLTLTDSLTDVHATMDATVELGNSLLRGFHAQTSGSVEGAVDQAIRRLVANILSNQEIRTYLAE